MISSARGSPYKTIYQGYTYLEMGHSKLQTQIKMHQTKMFPCLLRDATSFPVQVNNGDTDGMHSAQEPCLVLCRNSKGNWQSSTLSSAIGAAKVEHISLSTSISDIEAVSWTFPISLAAESTSGKLYCSFFSGSTFRRQQHESQVKSFSCFAFLFFNELNRDGARYVFLPLAEVYCLTATAAVDGPGCAGLEFLWILNAQWPSALNRD